MHLSRRCSTRFNTNLGSRAEGFEHNNGTKPKLPCVSNDLLMNKSTRGVWFPYVQNTMLKDVEGYSYLKKKSRKYRYNGCCNSYMSPPMPCHNASSVGQCAAYPMPSKYGLSQNRRCPNCWNCEIAVYKSHMCHGQNMVYVLWSSSHYPAHDGNSYHDVF